MFTAYNPIFNSELASDLENTEFVLSSNRLKHQTRKIIYSFRFQIAPAQCTNSAI